MAAVVVYCVLTTLISLFVTYHLLHQYAHHHCGAKVRILVFTSWFVVFLLIAFLPADLATAPNSPEDRALFYIFSIIYWYSYALMWGVLPIAQEYWTAGDFTPVNRLKTSLSVNAKYYAVVTVLFVAFLVYLLVRGSVQWADMVGFCVALANAWGLTLLVLSLGYGIVEVPRKMWYSGNIKVRLNYLYYKVATIRDELENSQEHVGELIETVDHVHRRVGDNESNPLFGHARTIKDKFVVCESELEAVRDQTSQQRLRELSKLSQKCRDGGEELTEKLLASLHKDVTNSVTELMRTTHQWVRLIEEVESVEVAVKNMEDGVSDSPRSAAPLNGHGFPNGDDGDASKGWRWQWKHRVKRPAVRAFAVTLALLSALILWCEVTLFVADQKFSVFAIAVRSTTNESARLVLGLIVVAYMSYCSFFAVFRFRVANYYHLHSWKGTEAPSLIMSATVMLRIVIAIAFNFLKIMGTTDSAFEEFLGHLDLVPIFGTSFSLYVPISISVVSFIVFFNIFGRIMRLLHFDRFEFSTSTSGNAEIVVEGKRIVNRERRRRLREARAANTGTSTAVAMDTRVHTNGRSDGAAMEFVRLS